MSNNNLPFGSVLSNWGGNYVCARVKKWFICLLDICRICNYFVAVWHASPTEWSPLGGGTLKRSHCDASGCTCLDSSPPLDTDNNSLPAASRHCDNSPEDSRSTSSLFLHLGIRTSDSWSTKHLLKTGPHLFRDSSAIRKRVFTWLVLNFRVDLMPTWLKFRVTLVT